ncbi:MAG: hypothetical protein AAF674_16915 [Pseudomonadota bacterium]
MTDLTDRQLALLMDLAALEDAGLIEPPSTLTIKMGRQSHSVDLDGVLTERGRGSVRALASRSRVLSKAAGK